MAGILYFALGNPLRGDDGAAPALLALLQAAGCPGVFLDGGVSPENYLGKVIGARPSRVIIIDAVQMSAPPGTVREFMVEQMQGGDFSTHRPPVAMLFTYLTHALPQVTIRIWGIQPESMELGEGLSPEVESGIKEWVEAVVSSTEH